MVFAEAFPLAAPQCCAMDGEDRLLAAGDASGRIQLWYNFPHLLRHPPNSKPAATTIHWHAHAVTCLGFSLDSVYLLSGGAEAVLVQWQLESGKRSYLPRLGGTLVGVQPCRADPAKCLVAQVSLGHDR